MYLIQGLLDHFYNCSPLGLKVYNYSFSVIYMRNYKYCVLLSVLLIKYYVAIFCHALSNY